MSKLSYFWKRLLKMDWKAMWKTTGLLKKRSGKGRIYLLFDMLRCAVKYNAGYMDYKIAQMYKLNDKQRATVITRGTMTSPRPLRAAARVSIGIYRKYHSIITLIM